MLLKRLYRLKPRPRSTFCVPGNYFGRTLCLFILHATLLFLSLPASSLTTQTLPESVRTLSLKYGQIQNLEHHYSENGALMSLTDYKAIEFNAATLAKYNVRAQQLIDTLNKFGLYRAGDMFNLGTLEIKTKPEIQYTAPIFGWGISSSWTLGIGVPVVHYKNTISLGQSFSNMDYYRQFRGLSPELDNALDTDLGSEVQKTVIQKGYKPIENRDQKFIGDIQLASIKKFSVQSVSYLVHLLTLTLPTGPAYNSDDLLALNSFHEFSIENKIGYVRQLFSSIEATPFLGFKYFIPQKITARVPKNIEDVLPDESAKDSIIQSMGPAYSTGLKLSSELSEKFAVSGFYEYGIKEKTQYSSSVKGDSSVLGENSDSRWQKVNGAISYSTVKSFLKKQSLIPFIIQLSVYDTIAGKNIERQFGQELNLNIFF